ncbi:MAG: hypothetical protein V1729_03940 [Candidatus Woesearchaeota archaeon]
MNQALAYAISSITSCSRTICPGYSRKKSFLTQEDALRSSGLQERV